jgi:hypothetical protein
LDLEFYGTVYLCIGNCITQLANELGYRSPAQHGVALDENRLLNIKKNQLLDKVERLENALGALRMLDGNNTSVHDTSVSPEPAESLRPVENSRAKPEPVKQAAKSRPADVCNDDSLTDLFGLGTDV